MMVYSLKMYYSAVVIVYTLIAVAKGFDITYVAGQSVAEFCAKELKVKPAHLKKALKYGNKHAKCLRHCITVNLNITTISGELIVDNLPQHTVLLPIIEIAQDCAEEHTAPDNCDRINNVYNCIRDKSIKLLESLVEQCAAEVKKKKQRSYEQIYQSFIINPYDQKLFCIYRCVLIKSKLLDDENNFKIEPFMPFFAGSVYKSINEDFEDCAEDNNKGRDCSIASNRIICAYKKIFQV